MSRRRDRALGQLEAALDSDFLKALSEPARVQILKALIAKGGQDLGQLSEPMRQERSVVSRHVKVLEQAGLVRVERDGRHRIVHPVPTAFIGRLEEILETTKRCVAICCPPD
jgi:DNA-binding transcriptional ArsR family regulator